MTEQDHRHGVPVRQNSIGWWIDAHNHRCQPPLSDVAAIVTQTAAPDAHTEEEYAAMIAAERAARAERDREIFDGYQTGTSQRALAVQYGITRDAVRRIITRAERAQEEAAWQAAAEPVEYEPSLVPRWMSSLEIGEPEEPPELDVDSAAEPEPAPAQVELPEPEPAPPSDDELVQAELEIEQTDRADRQARAIALVHQRRREAQEAHERDVAAAQAARAERQRLALLERQRVARQRAYARIEQVMYALRDALAELERVDDPQVNWPTVWLWIANAIASNPRLLQRMYAQQRIVPDLNLPIGSPITWP